MPVTDLTEREFSRLCSWFTVGDGCWQWSGNLAREGYGTFFLRGHSSYAHRFLYELLVGEIPEGLVIDHLCRNRGCVNPGHMEVVTRTENVMRGVGFGPSNRRKTHCPRGHEYTPDNTWTNSKGWRWCRECNRLKMRQLQAEGRMDKYRKKERA